jgi:hypothetical protein
MAGIETSLHTAAATTLAQMTRATRWELVGERPLRFDAHHPQGMVRIDSVWWISTVDIETHEGWVLAVDEQHGGLLDRVSIGDAHRYHPGGMDFDGAALWIPVAEYRPHSTSTVFRMVPGSQPEAAFGVDDHVGAMARCGDAGDLVGWSWGSRRYYRWSVDGQLRDARVNPAFFVDHQDCQWLGGGYMVCGGVAQIGLADGPGWLGGLGLLRTDDLVMERELPFPFYSRTTTRVATQNPLWTEVNGDHLLLHLLPDDGAGTIVTYATPVVGREGQ